MGRKNDPCQCCCIVEYLHASPTGTFVETATNDRFNEMASSVTIARPKRGQGQYTIYAQGQPPSGYWLTSTARVKLYDNPEGSVTASLVQRQTASLAEAWVSNFNPSAVFSSYVSAEGTPTPYYNGTPYFQDFNNAPAPAVVAQQWFSATSVQWSVFYAWSHMPEAADSMPAIAGTSVGAITGLAREDLKTLVIYSEDMRLTTFQMTYPITWYGGWISSEEVAAGSPPQTIGYDSSFYLTFAGNTRWLNMLTNQGPASQNTFFGPADIFTTMDSYMTEDDTGETQKDGVFTLRADRPPIGVVNAVFNHNPYQYPEIVKEYDDLPESMYGYATKTIRQFRGNEVTVYRDGVEVLKATRPTIDQSRAASQQEGSYFVVDEFTGASDIPTAPSWYNRPAQEHKTFHSVVIDKTKPIVGFTAVGDFYGFTNLNYGYAAVYFATEPVNLGSTINSLQIEDKDEFGIVTAPSVWSFRSLAYSPQSGPDKTLMVSASLNSVRDYAGNPAEYLLSHSHKVRAYPAKVLMTGASPSLPRFDPVARRQTQRIGAVQLSFDRPINPAGVNASQCTLKRNGVVVPGVTMAPIGDGSRDWLISIPLDAQSPRSVMLLEYDPKGEVFTTDIYTERYDSRASFPETGKFRTRYVYTDSAGNDQWFSWSLSGYVQIAREGNPRYPYAPFGDYTPEPSLLVARTSWLMADENGRPRLIDVSSVLGGNTIGRVASITRTVSVDTANLYAEAQSSEPATQSQWYDEVSFKRYPNRRGYLPSVPTLTNPQADHSYFGLGTTIDPCPPAIVHECAAPRVAQTHSSAIRCDSEITGFSVSLEMRDTSGALVTDYSTIKRPNGLGDVDDVGQIYKGIGAFAWAMGGSALTFGTSLSGRPLSQNIWGCTSGAVAGSYPIEEYTSKTQATCGTNKYYLARVRNCVGEPDRTALRGENMKKVRNTFGNYTIDGVQGMLSAFRQYRKYTALNTTTLFDLTFLLSIRFTILRTMTYKEFDLSGLVGWFANCAISTENSVNEGFRLAAGGCIEAYSGLSETASKNVQTRFFDYMHCFVSLTKQDEESLANGNAVRKAVATLATADISNSGKQWTIKIQKQ